MSSLLIWLILHFLHHGLTYQQTPSKELTFCLNTPTTSSTLQTFWQDANINDCELDALRLVEQYTKLMQSDVSSSDRCTLLLLHHMRKQLISIASAKLEEAFVMQTLNENQDVNRLLEEIHLVDKRISQVVWERALGEVLSFVDVDELIESVLGIQRVDLQVYALQFLLSKINLNARTNTNTMPLFTYTLSKLIKGNKLTTQALQSVQAVYNQLPPELRLLYTTSSSSALRAIGLLNRQHWEYLYAPRDNGPDQDKRIPLTWSKEKNDTDNDGHFHIDINAKGSVTLGSRFGAAFKHLYADADNKAPYFWIGSGSKLTQWWKVIWSSDVMNFEDERSIALQNEETKDFLCATDLYDENRRYVILMNGQESVNRLECHWLIREIQ